MKPAGNRARLADGPIGPTILSLMVPMMLGMIALMVNNLAGAFFVGRIGTDQLAAVAFTFPVSFIVGAISMGLGVGTSSVASRLFGQGQREDVQRITGHALLLGLSAGVIVTAIGLSTIDPVFRLLGADSRVLPLIHQYMHIFYWGGLFLVVPMISNSVLRASGDARRPALITTSAAVFNIIIDPVLIFGLLGFPRMELRGAALGAVLSNMLTMVVSVYFIMHREHLVNYRKLALDKLWDSWERILKVGLPAMTSSLVAPLTTGFITHQVAIFGAEAVAGFGVASRVEGMSTMALMSLSAAMTPFVGQNVGARRMDRVQDGVAFAYRFSFAYGIAIAAVLGLLAPYIAAIFTSHPEAQHAAILQLRIVPLGYLALGVAMTVNGSFNAMGRPMAAMFVSLSRTILVYAPLAWVLSGRFGLIGIYIAACLASFVAGGIGFTWLKTVLNEKLADMEPVEQQA